MGQCADEHPFSPWSNASGYWGAGATYKKMSQMNAASSTFTFIEDADNRGYNKGSWAVSWNPGIGGRPSTFTWGDPPAMFHGNVNTMSFGDGHAESRKWLDGKIVTAGKNAAQGRAPSGWTGPTSGPDYDYVYQGYRFPGWQ